VTAKPTGQATLSAVMWQKIFHGPLPPPELLEHYEQICPGIGERMMEMVRVEGEHRRQMESSIFSADCESMRRQFSEARLGQIFAFIIALAFVAVGGFLVDRGHPISGTLLGGGGLGGIVTTFILGRNKSNSDGPPKDQSTELDSADEGKTQPRVFPTH
jgi:uncharacterized membrane protein